MILVREVFQLKLGKAKAPWYERFLPLLESEYREMYPVAE